MPLQGFMLILFMLAVIPVIALSANHEIYFIMMSLILAVASIRGIYRQLTGGYEDSGTEGGFAEDMEEMADLDMKKFGTGIDVVKSLFIILFLIYCSFFLVTILFKAVLAAAAILQVSYIIQKTSRQTAYGSRRFYKFKYIVSSISICIIIVATVLTKLNLGCF